MLKGFWVGVAAASGSLGILALTVAHQDALCLTLLVPFGILFLAAIDPETYR